MVLDRTSKAVLLKPYLTGFALEITSNEGASCEGPGRRNGQSKFNILLEDFFAVYFEEEPTIMHKQNREGS